MDWGRAKNVLIFSFLLLNILLGYQLWLDVRERLNSNIDVTDLPQVTLSIMQDKNIRLLGKIPVGTPELKDLTYRFVTEPGNQEIQELETPVASKIIFSEKELLEGLGGVIPELEQYAWDPEASRDGVFVLYRMAEGLPIFKVKLELMYNNQMITAYRQDLVDQVQLGEAKAERILPASKAVGYLIENFLQQGAVIKDIKLGFHGQVFDSATQVSAPSWRVLLEDGEVYYVHAISAEVVTEKEKAAEEQGP